MTDYTIRPAVEADAETITRMVRSAPLDPNAVDWHYFLVLEIMESGAPKIVCIGMVHPADGVQEVDSVVTLEAYRRRGYAEALVRALMERAGKPLYLLAEPALVPYYEKFGFRVMDAPEAPQSMVEQRDWVNDFLKGRYPAYSVMGITD